MASSSSSLNWVYNVFLSFRGEDVRATFRSHFLKELDRKLITVFKDNEIERSHSLWPELVQAIRTSRIAVVIFSKNYASSSWCLNELLEIVNCKDNIVIPVFYGLDPSHVRNQTGDFGRIFQETCKKNTEEKQNQWKKALTDVANMLGFHSATWDDEAKMIEEITNDVLDKLLLTSSKDSEDLVGIEAHIAEISLLLQLESGEVRMVGIWGSSGIGKSTIARAPFNRLSRHFQSSKFIDRAFISNSKKDYSRANPVDPNMIQIIPKKFNLENIMPSFSDISDVKPYKNLWKIKVKIVHLWKQFTSGDAGGSLEIVLIDQKGSKIQARVKKALLQQFETLLHEGHTYIIYNFIVNNVVGAYRTTKNAYKITFMSTTKVKKCDHFPSDLSGIEPINFNEILGGKLNTDFLIDVIGQIVNVGQIENSNGKDDKKLSLELRNPENIRLPVVLWGQFAEKVNEAVIAKPEENIIFVLQLGKIKIWKENISVSSAFTISKLSLNPNIKEVTAFVAMLPKDNLELVVTNSSSLLPISGVGDREDFLVKTKRKTIKEILETSEVENCITMGTIKRIDEDMGWYYLSCKKCSKKVLPVPDDDFDSDVIVKGKQSYYCEKCNNENPDLIPRYKLHISVFDNTERTKLLLFDNIAMQIIGQQAFEFTGPIHEEDQNCRQIPQPISNIVGKTFHFKISIERENYIYKKDTFKVLKIITNLEILSEFNTLDSMIHSSFPQKSSEVSLSYNDVGSVRSNSANSTGKRRDKDEAGYDEIDQNSSSKKACVLKIKTGKFK